MLRRGWLRPFRFMLLCAVALLAVAFGPHLLAQSGNNRPQPGTTPLELPSNRMDPQGERDAENMAAIENSQRRTREKERQRRIVDDAKRLVQLTAQYRAQVEKHETPNAEDQKLLAEIERLAREVKDRMRGM